jgi:chromosome segregation ATPase
MDIRAQIHQELEKLQSELEKIDSAVQLVKKAGESTQGITDEAKKLQTEYKSHLEAIQTLIETKVDSSAEQLANTAEKVKAETKSIKKIAEKIFESEAEKLNIKISDLAATHKSFANTVDQLIRLEIPNKVDLLINTSQELKEEQVKTQELLTQQFEASQKKTGQLQILLIASVGLGLLSIILHFV